MLLIKAKYIKNSKPAGVAYTFRSAEPVVPGDKILLPGGGHGIVVEGEIDVEWVKSYGEENIKVIDGKEPAEEAQEV